MTFKSPIQPLCRSCGTAIKKWTVTVYVKPEPTKFDHPHALSRYAYTPQRPVSVDDCRKLTNQQIVSVKRSHETLDGERTGKSWIDSFNEWDGETYDDEFFCTGRCARTFAYAMARQFPTRGLSGWITAITEQRQEQRQLARWAQSR